MIFSKIKAFTFIELIVVVTILSIMGIIGFYTFISYLQGARDSSKVTALNNIKTTIVHYKLNKGFYPLPNNRSTITYSGSIVWSQGTFGQNIIDKVNGSKENILDPYTNNEYTYSLTSNRKNFQIAGVLEKTGKAFVLGDYNGRIININILGIDNILALPSIIASDLSSTDLVDIINSNRLVYDNSYNVPYSYISTSLNKNKAENLSSNNLLIYSGSLSDFKLETNRLTLLNSIKQSYKGTLVGSIGGVYYKDLNIDLINPSVRVLSIACDIIDFDLGYPIECSNDSFFATAIFNINLLNIDFSGLISQNVNTVFQDNNGNIWFGTDKGLSKYSSGIWTSYTTGNGLIDNTVKTVIQGTNGNIWVGTSGGISVFNGTTGNWTSYTTGNGLVNNTVKTVTQGTNGNIWVGTNGGISVFNGTTGNLTSYTTGNGLVNNTVKTVIQSTNGNMWVGTNGGISVFNGTTGNWTSYTTSNGLVNNEVQTILNTSSSNIWVGTEKGISVFNPISLTWTPYTNNLVATDIKNIFQDSTGKIWISTYKGANMFNGTSWVQYTVTNGLISNKIKSIFQDINGIIWFITKKGLSKMVNGSFINYPNTNNSGIYIVYQGGGITVLGIN